MADEQPRDRRPSWWTNLGQRWKSGGDTAGPADPYGVYGMYTSRQVAERLNSPEWNPAACAPDAAQPARRVPLNRHTLPPGRSGVPAANRRLFPT